MRGRRKQRNRQANCNNLGGRGETFLAMPDLIDQPKMQPWPGNI